MINGASVIEPDTTSKRAQAILAYFQGKSAQLDTGLADSTGSSSPSSSAATTSTTVATSSSASAGGASANGTTSTTATTLDPEGRPPDLVTGVVPPDDPSCR
jgi:hypothetical protein